MTITGSLFGKFYILNLWTYREIISLMTI